ncbi:MAG: hypothetical protein ACI87W_001175 [Halieaceae bacterium]|jgi:hypothetical protein
MSDQSSALKRSVAALLIALLFAPPSWAQGSVEEQPNPFAMVGDLLVARPIGLVMTAAGAAAFVVSLPFTLLAGSVSETADLLVLGPAETTFVRCLGCRQPGYSNKDVEIRQSRNSASDE